MQELRAIFVGAIALVTAIGSAGVSAAETPQLTPEQWRQDLDVMVSQLVARHPNPFNKVKKVDFDASVDDLRRRIPGLTRNQVIVGMMRLSASIGDGHTRIEPRKDPAFQFPSLPLRLYWFEDGLYVRAARRDLSELVGGKVEAIGGVPVAEAMRRAGELASRDNAMGPLFFAPLYLAMPDILQAIGLSERRDTARLTLVKNGRRWTTDVPVGDVAALWPPDTDVSFVTPEGWVDAAAGRTPMWLQAPNDYHRLIELDNERALYAQLNMVTDTQGQTLAQFGERILERARSSNPRAVILDLRLNQGGGGHLRNGLIRALIRAEDADTRLFILTARGTFSASQFILDDLTRLTNAVVIGEPASSKPTHYGDSYKVTLPNSAIASRVSIKYWQSGQDKREWTPVDRAVPFRFADYAQGADPVLETALRYAPRPPLSEQLLAASSVTGTLSTWRTYFGDPVNRYADRAEQTLDAMVALAGAGKLPAALALGQAAHAEFPRNEWIAYVLGAIAEEAKQPDLALKAARAALAIDPNYRQAQNLVDRLAAAGPKTHE